MSTQTPALVGLGETLYGPTATIDTSDYGSSLGLEGTLGVFDFTDPTDPTKKDNRKIRAIFVRNTSGITLMRRMCVIWSTTAGERGKRVTGYSNVEAEDIAGVVDDRLGTAGVRNGDMFWLMVEGPVLIMTCLAADITNRFSAGEVLFAQTAAASTANTTGSTTQDEGGNMMPDASTANATGTETQTTDGTLYRRTRNAFGRALSAATTAETRTAKLVDLNVRR